MSTPTSQTLPQKMKPPRLSRNRQRRPLRRPLRQPLRLHPQLNKFCQRNSACELTAEAQLPAAEFQTQQPHSRRNGSHPPERIKILFPPAPANTIFFFRPISPMRVNRNPRKLCGNRLSRSFLTVNSNS